MVNNFKQFLKVVVATVGIGQTVHGSLPPKKVSLEKKARFTKQDCKMLISQQEQQYKIPAGLLAAIASIESEFSPYAVNCNGASKKFTNLSDAKLYVTSLRDLGFVDINIGALQINYGYHNKRFKNAVAILDPYQNISYAAKYLASLKAKYGSWVKAVKFYHSPDHKCQEVYMTKVLNSLKRINNSTYCEISGVPKVSLKPVRNNSK